MNNYFLIGAAFLIICLSACQSIHTNESSAEIETFQYNNINFRYVIDGQGPPLVVIGSSVQYPRAFARSTLPEHFRLVFADSRHFIPSYDPADEELNALTIDNFADDLDALRRHLGIATVMALGRGLAFARGRRVGERISRMTTG